MLIGQRHDETGKILGGELGAQCRKA
jgi:hypothetical protein